MGGKAWVALVLFAVLLGVGLPTQATEPQAGVRPPALQQIGSLNRSELLAKLNKEITIEGYYYDGSIPMVVENMELVGIDAPMPPDQYVALTGPIPPSFKAGAKVRLTGQVEKPTVEALEGESVAIRVGRAEHTAVLQVAPAELNLLRDLSALKPPVLPTARPAVPKAPSVAKRYALLIGGGANPANNHIRYWRDLFQMYRVMLSAGFEPADIRVAYASGVPRTSGMPVNYPATLKGIRAAFSYFVPRVKAADNLYIFVCGQGDKAAPGMAGPTHVYWAWGKGPLSPAAFAYQVKRITTYKRMVIHMTQAYSGGFITQPLRGPKRVIVTSASADVLSWAHPSLSYGNFNYWYLSALAGRLLIGGAPVNADANGDGQVSIAEAYNFTLPRPGGTTAAGFAIPPISDQMPQVEDNGAPPSRFGPLPGAGEGFLAAQTRL